MSGRPAARVIHMGRSSLRYQSIPPEQTALRKRIQEIAETSVRHGCRRAHILPRREVEGEPQARVSVVSR